jgi:hypothetical protein
MLGRSIALCGEWDGGLLSHAMGQIVCKHCGIGITTRPGQRPYCSPTCRILQQQAELMAAPIVDLQKARALRRATATRRPPDKGGAPSEQHEQIELAMWLSCRDILFCHVPNGEQRSWVTGKRLKTMGVQRGVPDILIFTLPPKHPESCGVAIELKRRGITACSPEQARWLAKLNNTGWRVRLCAGAAEAIAWLKELGYAD